MIYLTSFIRVILFYLAWILLYKLFMLKKKKYGQTGKNIVTLVYFEIVYPVCVLNGPVRRRVSLPEPSRTP